MKANILLIDDEPKVLESLKRALHQEPYQIFTASSAKDAIKIINSEKVDVVVCDHDMPHISGAELLSMFKTEAPNVIRIMLTGKGNYYTALKCINTADVFRFLTKPCSSTELSMSIRQALDQSAFMYQTQHLLHSYRENKKQLQWVMSNYPDVIDASDCIEEEYVDTSSFSQQELLDAMNRELS